MKALIQKVFHSMLAVPVIAGAILLILSCPGTVSALELPDRLPETAIVISDTGKKVHIQDKSKFWVSFTARTAGNYVFKSEDWEGGWQFAEL